MRASLLTLAFFSTLLGGVIADTDHHNPPPPPPPPPPHSHCPGGSHNYKPLYKSVYTVPHKSNADDVPAVTAALSKYGKNSTILFEKGVTYNIWTVRLFLYVRDYNSSLTCSRVTATQLAQSHKR
jgi:hypothetical protein